MELDFKNGRTIVEIGGSLGRIGDLPPNCRNIILTDGNVRRLQGKRFPEGPIIEMGEGEESKSFEQVREIFSELLELDVKRTDRLVGIGGGIVCDIAGFVSSTWMRGMRLALLPTTLLAQADAAIGGKNGFNLGGRKNMVGTFKQPEKVLCDVDVLATLEQDELRNGLAEIIKHACIADASFLEFLDRNIDAILADQRAIMEKAIHDSVQIKARIVQQDELESGKRMVLNLGHTLGHAIESTGLNHGEAVSIGMALSARISMRRGKLGEEETARIISVLKKAGLPTELEVDAGRVLEIARSDKKIREGKLNFVMLEGIGKPVVVPTTLEEISGDLNDIG